MKHLRSFNENIELDIDSICKEYNIKNYTINPDGTIDVNGNVNFAYYNLIKLPLKFNKVSGYFTCSRNKLATLEGSPKEVGMDFYCDSNKLTTLEGCPKEVSRDFICAYNQLITLEGGPTKVGGNFSCSDNQLTSLEGSPREIGGDFYCYTNKLTTLEGGPIKVGMGFDCRNNLLPGVILYSKYRKKILLEGDDFYIWKKGKLDMSSFEYMIDVFKDEE